MITKRATIKDVARRAGVSYQTVSRVINGKAEVLPATQRRVEQAMREMNYRPSAIARSMVAGRTFMLGCVVPDLTDYTFACLVEGAEAYVRARGYFLLSASAPRMEDAERFCEDIVRAGRVDGVLVLNPYTDARYPQFEELSEQGIPVIFIGAHPRQSKTSHVHLDDAGAGYQATKILLALGHTRIATLLGPTVEACATDRLSGYRRALTEANIPFSKKRVANGDWSATSGYEGMKQLLATGVSFTALFAQNDRMAVGAIRALRENGIRVPEDVSIIGFDDMPLASYFDPPLTTMHQDMFRIGQTAAQLMVQSLENPDAAREHIIIPAEPVVRASTRQQVPNNAAAK